MDRDDHLSLEEYSIARFLVEEVKKGRGLPKELPSFLLPGCKHINNSAPPFLHLMGREFCKFQTGFTESQKADSARADSPGILTFFS